VTEKQIRSSAGVTKLYAIVLHKFRINTMIRRRWTQ